MISCVVVFDGRVTRFVFDDTRQWLLGSCVTFSQAVVNGHGVEKLISKLINSHRSGKTDLLCISV